MPGGFNSDARDVPKGQIPKLFFKKIWNMDYTHYLRTPVVDTEGKKRNEETENEGKKKENFFSYVYERKRKWQQNKMYLKSCGREEVEEISVDKKKMRNEMFTDQEM
jgi:hypothetical protein